ncbi:MAG: NAD-dependent epimerase/dehydratase family protein [Candidatus Methylomirabilia bacterium]
MDVKDAAPDRLPSIIVTGASGLVGRNFINAVRDRFHIYALARRGQPDAEVPVHENVRWYRCDVGDREMLSRVMATIAEETAVDFVFHFAGYYDYDYRDFPEYTRTNVEGTRHLLDAAERLRVKRFIFASSLAGSAFSDPGRVLDETTPLDADFAYARSKREAEALVAARSRTLPCAIVRLAAIYSDWCEYAPLYILLNTWIGGGPLSRILVGQGETAVPYLHVSDLNCCWLKIVDRHAQLDDLEILIASPSECVTHNELYRAAAQGVDDTKRAVYLPVWLAVVGVAARRLLGLIIGRPPFERTWMLRYIDRKMRVDARRTHQRLGWAPRPRLHVMRRLLFLIENLKRDPQTWERRNLAMTKHTVPERPGLKIYNGMVEVRERVVCSHLSYLTKRENRLIYPHYAALEPQELHLRSELLYQLIESSMRLGDHGAILTYANHLARRRFSEGFAREELCGSLEHLADTLEEALKRHPGLAGLERRVHFDLAVIMQLILDEIEDVYEGLAAAQ